MDSFVAILLLAVLVFTDLDEQPRRMAMTKIWMPLWVLAASLWLRREQTDLQKVQEETSDLRHYIERLDALYYHTPLPGNRFGGWLVKQIHSWIDAEKAVARQLIMTKLEAVASS